LGAQRAHAAFRAPATTAQFLPEIDDEVLVAFECATPRAAAILFNPTAFSLHKPTPWQTQSGDVGMIREGNYRVVVHRRDGIQPLALALILAQDPALQHNLQLFRVR
jgi:hypothetical protein